MTQATRGVGEGETDGDDRTLHVALDAAFLAWPPSGGRSYGTALLNALGA